MSEEITCNFCGNGFSKRAIRHHLKKCPDKENLIKKNESKKEQDYFLIQAKSDIYSLFVLIPSDHSLIRLDQFLRDIWLECCGHLSCFTISGERYEKDLGHDDFFEANDMNTKLKEVLGVGMPFSHEYDYGSTTYVDLKVMDLLRIPLKKQILLCARNKKPKIACSNCENLATSICSYCQECLCQDCISNHSCVIEDGDHHMVMNLVNSPRTGVCGYC